MMDMSLAEIPLHATPIFLHGRNMKKNKDYRQSHNLTGHGYQVSYIILKQKVLFSTVTVFSNRRMEDKLSSQSVEV
jgi:hypothetical protein